jgi:hypothetical protein
MESLGSWLHGVAYRTALKAQSERVSRQRRELRVPARPPETANDDPSWRDVQQVLHAELNRLSERYRAPLVLCYLEGKTQDDAASLLGVSKEAIKKRLERGRAVLLTRLVGRGLGPNAALAAAAWPAATLACPPAGLVSSALKAAMSGMTAGVVSARVMALKDGVVQAMLMTKLKIVTAILLVVAVVTGGAVVPRLSMLAAEQAPPAKTDKLARQDGELPKAEANRIVDTAAEPSDLPAAAQAQQTPLTEPIWGIAFSPDGKTLAGAAAGKGGKIFLWDALSGRQTGTLAGHPGGGCVAVAFSPDGRTLASAGGDKAVKLWNAKEETLAHSLAGHRDAVRALSFSPDGKTLSSGSQDRTVCLWNVETGTLRRTLKLQSGAAPGQDDRVASVSFARDGKTVASRLFDGRVLLWNALTGELSAVLEDRGGGTHVAFAQDGRLATAGGGRNEVNVWDVAERKIQSTYTGHKDTVIAVAFSHDGALLASGGQGPDKEEFVGGIPVSRRKVSEIKVWDAATKKEIWSRQGELGRFKCVSFSSDGALVASCDDAIVMVNDAKTGAEKWKVRVTPDE